MKILFLASLLLFVECSGSETAVPKGKDVILRLKRNNEYYTYTYAIFKEQIGSTIYVEPRFYGKDLGFKRDDVILDMQPLKEELKAGVRVIARIGYNRYGQDLFIPAKIVKEKNNGDYDVKPVCAENKAPPLGFTDGYVYVPLPDDAFTASSYYSDEHKPSQARITETRPWCAASNDMKKPWLQVALDKDSYICSVTTKMYGREDKAVTAFTLAVSKDNQVWHHLMENNKRKIFKTEYPFTHSVNLVDTLYKYIRFYPVSYHKHPCMAVEVSGYGNFQKMEIGPDKIRMKDRCKLTNKCSKTKNGECGKEGDTLGTYTCRCKSGFRGPSTFEFDEDHIRCTDIDECQNVAVCGKFSTTCTNTPGSYKCNCKKGYENPNGILTICKDINECLRSPCSRHARCTNTDGSFTCQCKYGYQGNGHTCVDIDECNLAGGSGICKSKYSDCTNSPGSYKCTCQAGFTGDGNSCTDINECKADPHPCKYMNGKCFNNEGSYSCQCLHGYNLENGVCQEIDECSNPDWNDCNQHATCTNKPGSYSCACKQGFTGSGYNQYGCSDIDECSEKNKCGAHSSCKNSEGSFTCTCDKGYTSHNGMNCLDIDECKTGKHNCHHLAICKNLPGSFTCLCPADFTGKGDVTDGCTALSWCKWKGTVKCNKEFRHCDDRIRRCTDCKSGYEEKNGACQDIDECVKKPCGQGAACVNTPGSFKCHCHRGYTFNSKTQKCEDMDECSSAKHRCHVDAVCENSPGSYSCKCKKGFGGDGFYCADTNECYIGAYKCPQNSVCSNTLGSYKCTCKMGYHQSDDKCRKNVISKKPNQKEDFQVSSLFDFDFLWSNGSTLRSQAVWKLTFLAATVVFVQLFM